MSKAAAAGRKRKSTHTPRKKAADGAIYGGLAMIGGVVIMLAFLLSGGRWQEGTVGYLAFIAVLVNLNTFHAWQGRHLSGWQASLARLPLRCVGFGNKGGKPIEAAKGQDSARNILLVSIVVSVLIIGGLAFWLF